MVGVAVAWAVAPPPPPLTARGVRRCAWAPAVGAAAAAAGGVRRRPAGGVPLRSPAALPLPPVAAGAAAAAAWRRRGVVSMAVGRPSADSSGVGVGSGSGSDRGGGGNGGKPRRVAIVGAGIGGLATALALLRTPGTGTEALTLVDARPGLDTALGGALNLTAGAAVLAALGVDVRGVGNPLARVVARVADGSPAGGGVLLDVDVAATVRRVPAAAATLVDGADGGVYAVTVMRDTLQQLLADAVVADGRVRS